MGGERNKILTKLEYVLLLIGFRDQKGYVYCASKSSVDQKYHSNILHFSIDYFSDKLMRKDYVHMFACKLAHMLLMLWNKYVYVKGWFSCHCTAL